MKRFLNNKEVLAMALIGLEQEHGRITRKIGEIKSQLGHHQHHNEQPKRRMSLAGRRRIAAAQRKRWAGIRAAKAKAARQK